MYNTHYELYYLFYRNVYIVVWVQSFWDKGLFDQMLNMSMLAEIYKQWMYKIIYIYWFIKYWVTFKLLLRV